MEHLEGRSHLAGIQVPLLPHQVLKVGDLTLIDKEQEFTRLSVVGLCSKQRHALEAIIMLPCHGGGSNESSVPPRQ